MARDKRIAHDSNRRDPTGVRRAGGPLGRAAVRLRVRAELRRASERYRRFDERLLRGGNEVGGFTLGLLLFSPRRAPAPPRDRRKQACADMRRMYE